MPKKTELRERENNATPVPTLEPVAILSNGTDKEEIGGRFTGGGVRCHTGVT